MKKLIILFVIAILGLADANARPPYHNYYDHYDYYGRRDWYLVPSATYMVGENNDGWASGITVGRYLDDYSNFSMEGYLGYFFSSFQNDHQIFSAMISYDDFMFRSRMFYGSAGIGIGIMTNGLTIRSSHRDFRGFTDAILPMKLGCGLALTRNLSIGINLGYTLDLSHTEHSLFTVGPTLNVRF